MTTVSKTIAVVHPQRASFSLGARRAWIVLIGSECLIDELVPRSADRATILSPVRPPIPAWAIPAFLAA
jgi:hypothetical protein